ncbi:microsomal peptidase [Candidatus Caldarchaeum subterraneum]|uniref:Microsomal peptidase n=2 Tax=Caldiarchaeum subterraneum TaxID=311458 RepID=E6P9C6_CALS0|nr:microsomal peptidase [Candidatus Caldarchaeum subterraneum]
MLPPLVDLHEDISLYYVHAGAGLKFKPMGFDVDLSGRHGDIPKYRRANVKLVFSSIAPLTPTISRMRVEQLARGYGGFYGAYRTRAPTLTTLEHIVTYNNLLRQHSKDLRPVLTTSDVDELGKDGRIGFLIAIEGAEPLEDVEDLEIFYKLGVRSLQLTWNFDNKYGATCMSKKDYGLTGDGEDLVRLCNEMGVIVDLSHASKRTTVEALSASKLPAIVSHANAKSVRNHARNLDDEELEALKNNGGVVGATFIPPTISDHASLKGLADHIMYIYEKFGPDILAIGTDFFGLLNVDEPDGLEDITKIVNLWNELLNRGVKESDVEKIAYLNALRVVRENAKRWV